LEKEIDKILNKVNSDLNFSPEHSMNFDSREDADLYNKAFILLKQQDF
jgi:hypothetical protein